MISKASQLGHSMNMRTSPIAVLLLLALGIVACFLSFRPGYVLFGWDIDLPQPDASMAVARSPYIWAEYQATGWNTSTELPQLPSHWFSMLLRRIGFSYSTCQRVVFTILFVLPGLSMYFFVRTVFSQGRSHGAAVIAATFYIFNVYTLIVWHVPLAKFQLAYGVLPLLSALLVRGVRQPSGKNLLYFAGATLLNSGSGANPAMVAAQTLVLCVLSIGTLVLARERMQTLKRLVSYAIVFILLSSWWLVQQIAYSQFSARSYLSIPQAREHTLSSIAVTSEAGELLNSFRLIGRADWFSNDSHGEPLYPFATSYDQHPLLALVGFALPIIGFSALCSREQGFEGHWVLIFCCLALLGLFLLKGISDPAGRIYEWAFLKVPGFMMFREQHSKFGMITAFSYAVLIGWSSSRLIKRLTPNFVRRYMITLVMVVLVSGFIFPYWRGQMFRSSLYVQLPPDYQALGEFAAEELEPGRVFTLPLRGSQGSRFTAYKWGYVGSGIDVYFVDRPIFHRSVLWGNPYSYWIADKVAEFIALGDLMPAVRLMQFAGVRYVLLHRDFDSDYFNDISPETIKNVLAQEWAVSLVRSFGQLDLYEMTSQDSVVPHIYAPQNLVYLQGDLDELATVPLSTPVADTAIAWSGVREKDSLASPAEFENTIVPVTYRQLSYSDGALRARFFIPRAQVYDFKRIANPSETAPGISQALAHLEIAVDDQSISLNESSSIRVHLTSGEHTMQILPGAGFPEEVVTENHTFEAGDLRHWGTASSSPSPTEMELSSDASSGHYSLLLRAEDIETVAYTYMRNFDSKAVYLVRFDYKTVVGDPPTLAIDWETGQTGTTEVLVPGDQWQHFERVLKPPAGAENLWVNLSCPPRSSNLFDNVEIVRMPAWVGSLGFVFQSSVHTGYKAPEDLAWTRVNPTRYVAHISGASQPYLLVLSETFHPGWRATVEGVKVPEDRHFLVNGYANAWWIERTGEYEITIEFWPQKLVLVGAIISGITLALCIGYAGIYWWRRRKRVHEETNRS